MDGNGRVDPLSLAVIQEHDEDVRDFVLNMCVIRLDHFSDFPIQLEEHRRIGSKREGGVGPRLDVDRQSVHVHQVMSTKSMPEVRSWTNRGQTSESSGPNPIHSTWAWFIDSRVGISMQLIRSCKSSGSCR